MICYVIGKGSIGLRHAENLKTLGEEVVHLSWRELDLKILDSYLFENQNNCCVVIATASNIRIPIIKVCSKNNVPMYIEKPIGYNKDDLKYIFSISKELQKRSFAGFMMRYHPLIRYLVELNLENIFNLSLRVGHNVNDWRKNWSFSKSYAAEKNGGGVLLDLCHEIDIAFLLCKSLEVQDTLSLGHEQFEVDMASSIYLSSDDGTICSISLDYLSPQLIRNGNIASAKKSLEYDLVKSSIKEVSKIDTIEKNFPIERNQIFIEAMEDFLNIVKKKKAKNKLAPRLDKVKDVCFHIADAWEKRNFVGSIEGNLK